MCDVKYNIYNGIVNREFFVAKNILLIKQMKWFEIVKVKKRCHQLLEKLTS